MLDELKANGGALSYQTRFALAKKAFTHTARYDAAIANWLTSLDADNKPGAFPEKLQLAFDKVDTCATARTRTSRPPSTASRLRLPGSIASYEQMQGKELSYNNIADADAAWECVKAFDQFAWPPASSSSMPTPAAWPSAPRPLECLSQGLQDRPDLGLRRHHRLQLAIDKATAEAVAGQFAEVIIAPEDHRRARAVFAAKQNLRVLVVPMGKCGQASAGETSSTTSASAAACWCRRPTMARITQSDIKVVTKRAPTAQEMRDLLFAWRVAKYVKSNAIVYCKDGMTVGVGAGQMSRVDSARIAAIKAENNGLTVAGSVVASDAFFPFRDGLDVLAKAGATAVIQPGGSVRDAEVIAAADEQNLAMVFTGFRHFRH
jgi:phosphoribosylaminoimidazolecarboxamide formyltransferase/IMP cyclohydrolase